MDGQLLRYGPKPQHVAFLSPSPSSSSGKKKALIAVGGLSCGLLFADYIDALQVELSTSALKESVHLCQPLLSSSHTGWGISSVTNDAAELDLLLEHLHTHLGFVEFLLLGGC